MGPTVWLIKNQGLPKPPWAQLQLPALRMLRAEYHGTSPAKNAHVWQGTYVLQSPKHLNFEHFKGRYRSHDSWLEKFFKTGNFHQMPFTLRLKAIVLLIRFCISGTGPSLKQHGSIMISMYKTQNAISMNPEAFTIIVSVWNSKSWFWIKERERGGRMSLNCLVRVWGHPSPKSWCKEYWHNGLSDDWCINWSETQQSRSLAVSITKDLAPGGLQPARHSSLRSIPSKHMLEPSERLPLPSCNQCISMTSRFLSMEKIQKNEIL